MAEVTRDYPSPAFTPLPKGRITEVVLAAPRGFCAGVVRAIDIVDLALERYGAPVYVKHPIVHNSYVVAEQESRGARTVDDLSDVPEGAVVVFSAHGSPPEDFAKAKARNLRVVDATCPLVIKVHNEAKVFDKRGRKLILVGHHGHQEVLGTMGQADMWLMNDHGDVKLPDWDSNEDVTVLTQTTLSVTDTARTVAAIKERFPNAQVRNDICYATTNRQDSVEEMCKDVELVLVIGSATSSNCNRLREVAERHGRKAYLVDDPSLIQEEWLAGVTWVGVTSGASTPEPLVEATLKKLNAGRVRYLTGKREQITFTLPKEFRGADGGRRTYEL